MKISVINAFNFFRFSANCTMSHYFITLFAPVVLVMDFSNRHVVLVKVVAVLGIECWKLILITVLRTSFISVSLLDREICWNVFDDLFASNGFGKSKNASSLRNSIISIEIVSWARASYTHEKTVFSYEEWWVNSILINQILNKIVKFSRIIK